jgi:ATP-dependent exoDNAse (exonuclease V) alpha subunit
MANESSDYTQLKEYLYQGHNVFLTGPGGVGKSFYINKLKKEVESISVTSTTGVSSFNLGAQTIHSFSGIGALKHSDTLESVLKRVKKTKTSSERIVGCSILVIDEISMLGQLYLEMLDKVFRKIRGKNIVFGGIQVIFTGDFLQLPPVDDEFCFKSPIWDELELRTIYLTKMYRVNDPVYTSILERVRVARHTAEDNRELYKRYFAYKEHKEKEDIEKETLTVRPTFLYSKKVNVQEKNMEELEKNPNERLIFQPQYVPGKSIDDSVKKTMVPLYMKVGAQVMLTVNMDCDNGLVNGSRGVVTAYENDMLTVKFLNNNILSFARHEFVFEEDGKVLYKIVQFPFILAYALSIHKVQGSTLDFAVIDIGHSVFESSMSYVALSRVRNLEGLFLEAFQPHKIFCNKDALAFYDQL